MGRVFITWAMLALVVASNGEALRADENAPEPKRFQCLRNLYRIANTDIKIRKIPRWLERLLAGGAITFVGGTLATNLNYHHDVAAFFTGQEHVGYGIYMDMDGVMATFSDEEKQMLSDPEANLLQIVKFLSHQLEGDDDITRLPADEEMEEGSNRHWYNSDYFTGIKASHFFIHDGRYRGVCKHKAAVLGAVLNKLGIEAKVINVDLPTPKGYQGPKMGHVYVYVPKLDVVADPMKKVVMDRAKYEKIFLTP